MHSYDALSSMLEPLEPLERTGNVRTVTEIVLERVRAGDDSMRRLIESTRLDFVTVCRAVERLERNRQVAVVGDPGHESIHALGEED